MKFLWMKWTNKLFGWRWCKIRFGYRDKFIRLRENGNSEFCYYAETYIEKGVGYYNMKEIKFD